MSTTAIPGLSLPTGFHIGPIQELINDRLLLPLNVPAPLGVLTNFTGTFTGKGFNLIFRPNSTATPTTFPAKPTQTPTDNVLELNLTQESLAFPDGSLGNVPNRGNGAQADKFLNGVPYIQSVSDVTNGSPQPIHFEPGIWLAVPSTTNPNEPTTLARMASVPHGVTINLQGASLPAVAGAPTIPAVDPTPFLSATRAPFRFASQTASDALTLRIPQNLASFITAGTITQAILDDPNTVLRNAIAGQNIVSTITIEVASAPETPAGPAAIPAVGGGNANIAFLVDNADVPNQQTGPAGKIFAGVKSTFWIETVEHDITLPLLAAGHPPITVSVPGHPVTGLAGPNFIIHPPFPIPHPITIKVRSTQIQYSQVVLLNFNGLTWPHVSVATLVPSTPITPTPIEWEAVRKQL